MGKFDGISLTPEDFGDQASTHTTLTGPQLKQLFDSETEKRAFIDLMKVLDESASANAQRAELIANIDKYAGVLIKLARKAALGI